MLTLRLTMSLSVSTDLAIIARSVTKKARGYLVAPRETEMGPLHRLAAG